MSKHPKYVPMTHKCETSWIGEADINWSQWEERIREEIGSPDFTFTPEDRRRISEALAVFDRNKAPVLAVERAKRTVRILRRKIEKTGLPDHHLLNPLRPLEPSDVLLGIGKDFPTEVFQEAMLHTIDDGQTGKTVPQRLAAYLAMLRKGEAVFDRPRSEAMAARLLREAFDRCGIPTNVTHTWHSENEGNENRSSFVEFALQYLMSDLGTDDAARKVLQRRLDEAERHVKRLKRLKRL